VVADMEVGRVTIHKVCDCPEPNGYYFYQEGHIFHPGWILGRDMFFYHMDGKAISSLEANRKRTCRYCKATLRRPK